jgi:hypothetical protein
MGKRNGAHTGVQQLGSQCAGAARIGASLRQMAALSPRDSAQASRPVPGRARPLPRAVSHACATQAAGRARQVQANRVRCVLAVNERTRRRQLCRPAGLPS